MHTNYMETASNSPLQSVLEQAEVVTAPSVYRQDGIDYDGFIDRLKSCDEGKALSFPLPQGVDFASFGGALRAAAIRRGENVSIRRIGSDIYVVRRNHARRTRKASPRDEQIIEALTNGETQAALAVKFSISRQRVEQIEKKYFVKGISPAGRNSSLLEFVAPYIENIAQRYCALCGSEEVIGKVIMCSGCRKSVKQINRVRSLLRSWRDKGKAQALRQAVYEIRKYNIKPEHLSARRAS